MIGLCTALCEGGSYYLSVAAANVKENVNNLRCGRLSSQQKTMLVALVGFASLAIVESLHFGGPPAYSCSLDSSPSPTASPQLSTRELSTECLSLKILHELGILVCREACTSWSLWSGCHELQQVCRFRKNFLLGGQYEPLES